MLLPEVDGRCMNDSCVGAQDAANGAQGTGLRENAPGDKAPHAVADREQGHEHHLQSEVSSQRLLTNIRNTTTVGIQHSLVKASETNTTSEGPGLRV